MKIKFLSPLWGHEHWGLGTFLEAVRSAGYDGVDTWVPDDRDERHFLFDYLGKHGMYMVAHQHSAEGSTFPKFRASFLHNLHRCAEGGPLLINSHTGKDYFSLEHNLELIDVAQSFSEETGIEVVHETHRGRIGYSPQMAGTLFDLRKDFLITADFSHWACVTESMLENFTEVMTEAIRRSRHIHARVGFEQGPQVADPKAPEWGYALNAFLHWWDQIVAANAILNREFFTITPEFGPPPYMPVVAPTHHPVSRQFEINQDIKDLLSDRYASYR